jgi:hypothetical protein
LRHQTGSGKHTGPDHVRNHGNGRGGKCQNASIIHESNRGKNMT